MRRSVSLPRRRRGRSAGNPAPAGSFAIGLSPVPALALLMVDGLTRRVVRFGGSAALERLRKFGFSKAAQARHSRHRRYRFLSSFSAYLLRLGLSMGRSKKMTGIFHSFNLRRVAELPFQRSPFPAWLLLLLLSCLPKHRV